MKRTIHAIPWLLAFFLLGTGACQKKDADDPGPQPARDNAGVVAGFEPFPEDPGVLEFEHWYTIHLQGQPAGSSHVAVTRHGEGTGTRRVVRAAQQLALRRGSFRVEISSEDTSLVNPRGGLTRHRHIERQAGGPDVVVEAGKLGDEMVTVRGPEVTRVPYEPRALDPQLPYPYVFGQVVPKPGDERRFRTYTSQSGSYTGNTLKVTGRTGDAKPSTIGTHTIDALPGVKIRVELDAHHRPVVMETGMGAMQLKFVRELRKPDKLVVDQAPDLGPLMTITANVDFKDRDAVTFARYRISGLPDHVDPTWLTGPGQKVTEQPGTGTFVIEIRRMDPPATRSFPPEASEEHRAYLEATAVAQADDKEIRALARQVTEGAPDAWAAARRLRAWVSEHIEGNMGMAFASAREVFEKKQGDCSEQSVLLATLARSVGIPARCVMGLVFQGGAFARHMWTEVHVDGWRPLDAAMNTDTLSGAWIRIGDYSLKLTDDKKSGFGGMTAFVSDLKITVEEYSER